MKILHVVRQFYPMIGGLENYVLHLSSHQIKQGHEVGIATLNRNFLTGERLPKKGELVTGQKIIRVPYGGIKKYPLAPKILKLVKNYDVVHVHAIDFFADFLAFTRVIHKKRLILTTHGGFFHSNWGTNFKKLYFKTITRQSLKAYDKVIGCSTNDIELFKEIFPGILLIENGVEVMPYIETPKKRIRGELTSLGRIDDHKRIDLLIEVAALLKEKNYNIHLNIVGPDWKKLIPGLKEKARVKGIAGQVTFTGPVSEFKIREILSETDVFLSASEYEGFGISALEAMASGTVCVLNNIPSFNRLLNGKPFGKICNFREPEEAANIISGFLDIKTNQYNNLSEEAKNFSREFDWNKVSLTVTSLYES